MTSLAPVTRQRIIDRVHATGTYRAHHDGVLMEIEAYQDPVSKKWGVMLKICKDKKWVKIPCETVFAAVEAFNSWLNEERWKRPAEDPQQRLELE
jgi:hypothetical protein